MFDEPALNSLYRYGLALTNDESLSYDLLQDALERYLKLPSSRRPENGGLAYLRTSMRNRYIDQLRHQQRFPSEPINTEDEMPVSLALPDPAELLIDLHALQALLERLQPLERELLHLWAYEEYTAQEIADLLATPRGTILARIHRLRKKIARLISELDEQEALA